MRLSTGSKREQEGVRGKAMMVRSCDAERSGELCEADNGNGSGGSEKARKTQGKVERRYCD